MACIGGEKKGKFIWDLGSKTRGEETLERHGRRWENTIKLDLKLIGPDGCYRFRDFCEYGNELLGYTKCWRIRDRLHGCLVVTWFNYR